VRGEKWIWNNERKKMVLENKREVISADSTEEIKPVGNDGEKPCLSGGAARKFPPQYIKKTNILICKQNGRILNNVIFSDITRNLCLLMIYSSVCHLQNSTQLSLHVGG